MPNYEIQLCLAVRCEDDDAAEVLCSDLRDLFTNVAGDLCIVSVESVVFQEVDPETYGIPM